MSENYHFEPEDHPKLNPMYLLRWEKSQDAYVLLYPEGIIKLNSTAAEILKLCTGESTVTDIIEKLKLLFVNSSDIGNSIHNFLEVTHGKGWINR